MSFRPVCLAVAVAAVLPVFAGTARAASPSTTVAVPFYSGVEVLQASTPGISDARVSLARGTKLPAGTAVVTSSGGGRVRVVVVRRSERPSSKRLRLVFGGATKVTRRTRGRATVTEKTVARSRNAEVCRARATPPSSSAVRLRGRLAGRTPAATMALALELLCVSREQFGEVARSALLAFGFSPGAQLTSPAPAPAPLAPAPVPPTAAPPAGAAGVPAPKLRISPGSKDFGAALASDGVSQTFRITNAGDAEAVGFDTTIAGDQRFNFFLFGSEADPCGPTLAPGASCSVVVEFLPQVSGPLAASLVAFADGTATRVALSGVGRIPGRLTVQSGEPNLGAVPIGRPAIARTFVLVNDGDVATGVISDAGREGANGRNDFRTTRSTCVGVIAAGETCEVDVAFAPVQVGPASDAQYFIDDRGGFYGLFTTGEGLAPVGATVEPRFISFPDTVTGAGIFTQVIVTNNRDIAVRYRVTSSSPKFTVDPTGACVDNNTAPGQSCTLNLNYGSQTAGTDTATLTIEDRTLESADFSTAATVVGRTFDAPLVFTPEPDFAFGPTLVGGSEPRSFTLTNASQEESIVNLSVESSSSEFFVDASSCAASLAPGSSCTGSVTFVPQELGERFATLFVSASNFGASLQRPMSGEGVTGG